MRFTLLLLCLMIPSLGVAAQKTNRTLVVGPTETATVEITTLDPDVARDSLPWPHASPPLAPGGSTSARLWTDLPITIGDLEVAPGRYNLWLQTGGTLSITRSTGDRDGFSSDDVIGSVAMMANRDSVVVAGWSLSLVSIRVIEATLTTHEDRTRPPLVVVQTRFDPGTRTWLRLRYLDHRFTVPVKAR